MEKSPLSAQLQKLDLSENEATILGKLIEHSPASATYLARSCEMSRSSVYALLAALISKGFVATTYKNDVKQFTVSDYSTFENYIAHEKESIVEKENAISSLKDAFEILNNQRIHVPSILFFEGIVGLKKIYQNMLREAGDGDTFYVMRDETLLRPEWKFVFEEQWQNSKRRKKISTLLLLNDTATERKRKNEYKKFFKVTTAFLPKNYPLKEFSIMVIGDMVGIISMKNDQLIGIQITSQHIADNYRQLFLSLLTQR